MGLVGQDGEACKEQVVLEIGNIEWRAQQYAARVNHSVEDLRRYCLDALRPRLLDDDDQNAYLRGYREGFQTVLREIRRLETRTRR